MLSKQRVAGARLKAVLAGLLLCLGLSTVFSCNAEQQPEWIKTDAPNSYIVKNGDTLWDIANTFLHDPWRWSEVWEENPDIENPNLIYPGDSLFLEYRDAGPRLCLTRKGAEGKSGGAAGGVVTLHPRIRILPADKPIPTIPLNVIGPFFNQSRVIPKKQVKCCPPIVALGEDHIVVGTGDYLYVSGLQESRVNDIFSIFKPNKTYRDPDTHRVLGVEALILGRAQIEALGQPARLRMLNSYEEVRVGDKLIQTKEEEFNPYFVPKKPIGDGCGQILSVFGGINQIGLYQIVTITGGYDKQRRVGDVLIIDQNKKDIPPRLTLDRDTEYAYPPLALGVCMVFRVFDETSFALVMRAHRAIYLLDFVHSP